jgi:hypothetical protein
MGETRDARQHCGVNDQARQDKCINVIRGYEQINKGAGWGRVLLRYGKKSDLFTAVILRYRTSKALFALRHNTATLTNRDLGTSVSR